MHDRINWVVYQDGKSWYLPLDFLMFFDKNLLIKDGILQHVCINPLDFFRLNTEVFHGLPLGCMVEALHQYRQIGLEQWI